MFEFTGYHLMLAAFGLAVILAHWLPRFFSSREPAASALLIGLGFLVFGWIPEMGDAISPISLPKPWEVVSEMCVVIGLFGVGLRIDNLSKTKTWSPTLRLLVIGMPVTIAAVAWAGSMFAGMTFAGALLLAAVLTPTDPVLAGDVQVGPPLEGGEHPVRFALTTEAGLNDGLAFPFVYLALAVATAGELNGELANEWLWRDVVYRIAVGGAAGAVLGWLLSKVLFDWPRHNSLANTESGVMALAGVLAVYGLTELAEGYGFIAAFVSGLFLRRQESRHEFHTKLHDFTESIEHALTAILLVALGAALPALYPSLTWPAVAISVGLILIIRPIAGWVALRGTMENGRERGVVAFYGVRGIGSIYYLAYASSHIKLINEAELWATVGFTILLSSVVHGFTAGFAMEKATGEV